MVNAKEKLLFRKGIYIINIPFLLSDLSPWQDQIRNELLKVKEKFSVRKSARFGFSITENGAEIKVYKKQ